MRNKTFILKILCFVVCTVLAAAVLLPAVTAYATELSVSPTCTETGNNMFEYKFPNGTGFTSTMKNGEQNVMLPFFMFDVGVSWKAYKNNAEYKYANYDIIQEKGNFLFVISAPVSKDSEDTYTVRFSFVSTYSDEAIQSEFEDTNTGIGLDGSIDDYSIEDMEKIFSDYRSEMTNEIADSGIENLDISNYLNSDVTPGYDKAKNMFTYKTSDNNIISTSVPEGSVTKEPVKIEYGEDIVIFASKDDETIDEFKSGDILSDIGTYSISFISNLDGDVDRKMGTVTFRIIGDAVNNLDIFNAPTDFLITAVKFEDEDCLSDNQNYYKMSIDGTYDFIVKYKGNSDISYKIRINRDVTAPVVKLSNRGMGYLASKPVDIYSVENGADLSVKYNNQDITQNGTLLDKNGLYKVTVSDQAENSRTYYVKVSLGFSISLTGVIITLVLIGAAFTYLYVMSKQKVQVL